ncbi:unnamed protein product [Trichobilharzia regenti]|nr:unnamed protein product [Trichobilharzia regenti]
MYAWRLLLAPLLEQNKKKSINQPEAASSSSTSLQSTSLSMLTNKLSHKARQLDISDEQFIQMIFDILASSKSSDEVQEEVRFVRFFLQM